MLLMGEMAPAPPDVIKDGKWTREQPLGGPGLNPSSTTTSCSPPLSLGFLICKTGGVIVPTSECGSEGGLR